MSRLWLQLTGDSYVVDVQLVDSAGKAASYLTKYLSKGSIQREKLEELGFKRLWSRSAGWPGEKMQLKQTLVGWEKVEFTLPKISAYPQEGTATQWLAWGERSPLAKRVGTDLARELANRKEDAIKLSEIMKLEKRYR